MQLLIIRHGDPDYKNDTLTEKGWREAEYLSERIAPLEVKDYYVSPMGRARDTASLTLKKAGREATVYEWLREFNWVKIERPDLPGEVRLPWDWLPADWTKEEVFYDHEKWSTNERMEWGRVGDAYNFVNGNFDKVLAEHGYVRDGYLYRAEKPSNDRLVFFCHFGLECVLLSHLLNISPMQLWHGTCAAPSSVTTVNTEERQKGIACFRLSTYGDISHLYAHGEEPSFAARFCSCYDNEGENRG